MNLDNASLLRDDIDVMLGEPMEEEGIRVSPLTGGLGVSLDINEGIHETQSYTTLLTLLILTIVLCIVFRSVRIGILTMIPVATIIIWQPLLMSSGDVNVNIFTAMIGTIVFGIGVDDAIHVMHRIQEEGETAIGMSRAVRHWPNNLRNYCYNCRWIRCWFLRSIPRIGEFLHSDDAIDWIRFLDQCILTSRLYNDGKVCYKTVQRRAKFH